MFLKRANLAAFSPQIIILLKLRSIHYLGYELFLRTIIEDRGIESYHLKNNFKENQRDLDVLIT